MTNTYSLSIASGLGLITAFVLLPAFALAAPAEKVDGFVCPVISTDAVLHSPKGAALPSGEYTIGAHAVSVPITATNDNGAGSPGGSHASPGDNTYTAIWNTSN